MTHVLDRADFTASAARPSTAEQILEELRLGNALQEQTRVVLVAMLAELQSWRAPEPASGCPHPEGMQQDMSSMGEKWIRCRACGADLVRKER